MVEWIERALRPTDVRVTAVYPLGSLGLLPQIPLDSPHRRDDDSDDVYDADDDDGDVAAVFWMVFPVEKLRQIAHHHHYRSLLARFLLAALFPSPSSTPCHPLRRL